MNGPPNRSQQEIIAACGEEGLRLDVLLSRRYERINRREWRERIDRGDVFVENRRCRASRRLKNGERILFSFIRREEPAINGEFRILHEDADLLVIDKPANLPVHPSGVYFQNTLLSLLKNRYGDDFTAHFAHRLDRETSGVLVLGRNRTAARALHRTFLEGGVRKEYLVLVEGNPPEYLDARGVLGPDTESPVRKKRRFRPANRPGSSNRADPVEAPGSGAAIQRCRTEFWIERRLGDITLLKARLHTGRLHQIRATLQSLGYPVVGDRLYGLDDRLYLKFIADEETSDDRRRLRLDRTALHCRLLEFNHPGNDRTVRFESPLPADINSLIRERRSV